MDEDDLSDWRNHGGGQNNYLSDHEEKTLQMCVFGRGLVLGHASVYRDRRDQDHGHGKYLFFAESIYSLFCV